MNDDEETDGLRVWVSRKSLGILAALALGGGAGLGFNAAGLLSHQPATMARLESCRHSENQCAKLVARYEVFAEKAVPFLETTDTGREITEQASLPRHLRFAPMGDSR